MCGGLRIKKINKQPRPQVLDSPQALTEVTEENRGTKESAREQRMPEEKKAEKEMWHRHMGDAGGKGEERAEPAKDTIHRENSNRWQLEGTHLAGMPFSGVGAVTPISARLEHMWFPSPG